jgi:hypothetical protein
MGLQNGLDVFLVDRQNFNVSNLRVVTIMAAVCLSSCVP